MNKYDGKYFGIATGILSVIIFLLAIIKMLISSIDAVGYVKPFIPFFNELNALTIIGGVAAAFIWGWILGYLYMMVYNFVDKRFINN